MPTGGPSVDGQAARHPLGTTHRPLQCGFPGQGIQKRHQVGNLPVREWRQIDFNGGEQSPRLEAVLAGNIIDGREPWRRRKDRHFRSPGDIAFRRPQVVTYHIIQCRH